MKKNLQYLQTIILFSGTIFAWYTVYNDFARFLGIYKTIFHFENCIVPNPLTTPCFYGAIGFLVAFVWSVKILKMKETKAEKWQKYLFIFLITGTIFGWSNFLFELYKFYSTNTGPKTSCSGIPTDNPFYTPCFYGSVLYLLSLISSFFTNKSFSK
jgi:hypothetical protein